jgi:ATP phosphoribosyltransferase regulatory subunit HisZ
VRAAAAAGLGRREQAALGELCEWHGGPEVLKAARAALAQTAAATALDELSRLVVEVQARSLAPKVLVDLGETRNFAYYTGTTFQLHADGPGVPVASGGRYDGLLGGFGRPLPAFGFAFGLDDLVWALGSAPAAAEPRLLLTGAAVELASALRQRGIRCAAGPEQDPLAYAKAWRYTHWVNATASAAVVVSMTERAEQRAPLDAGAVARLVTG